MERTVHAPDKDWLTAQEAASWLNIKRGTFELMVEKGLVPKGRRFTKKTERWHWQDVWAVGHLLAVCHLKGLDLSE